MTQQEFERKTGLLIVNTGKFWRAIGTIYKAKTIKKLFQMTGANYADFQK